MIYGLYLSASGIMTNSYRQDVIANNLANSETVGFKRDLAQFQERRTASHEPGNAGKFSDPLLDKIGGGILATATQVDTRQGDLENTGNTLDVAIQGDGFFTVAKNGVKHLTRDGNFMLNRQGDLILTTDQTQKVLDDKGKPIRLTSGGNVQIDQQGQITQNGAAIAKLAMVDVDDHSLFSKQGGTLLAYPEAAGMRPATGVVYSGFQERSNVDPTTELSELMDTQRQLEANANMLKDQDTMLQKLVNDVGKIS